MITQLTINETDLQPKQLTSKERQAIVDAWNEYAYDRPIYLNTENRGYMFFKEGIIDFLSTAMFGELMHQSEIYGDFDLDNEDDYDAVVKGIIKEAKRKNI